MTIHPEARELLAKFDPASLSVLIMPDHLLDNLTLVILRSISEALRQRDEALERNSDLQDDLAVRKSEVERLKATQERLIEALRPLASHASELNEKWDSDTDAVYDFRPDVGDIRRAAYLIKELTDDKEKL